MLKMPHFSFKIPHFFLEKISPVRYGGQVAGWCCRYPARLRTGQEDFSFLSLIIINKLKLAFLSYTWASFLLKQASALPLKKRSGRSIRIFPYPHFPHERCNPLQFISQIQPCDFIP